MSPPAISKWVCTSCAIYVRQDKCVICALFSFNPRFQKHHHAGQLHDAKAGPSRILKNPSEGGGESSLELSTKSAKRKRRWFYKLSINWIRKRAERDPQACI